MNQAPPHNATGPTHPWWTTALLATLHAVLFALAFPPYFLWPLILIALVPLGWLAVRARSTRPALAMVFATQFVMWLWMGRWLIEVTVAGYPVYAAYLSVYPVLFVWLVRRAGLRRRLAGIPMTLLVPILWVGLEALKGKVVFSGYPWFLLAHPMVQWPMYAQSADVLGAYFVSFLTAMWAGLILDYFLMRAGMRDRRAVARLLGLTAFVHGASLGYGAMRLGQDDSIEPGPRVLAIQTNLPQDNKNGWPLESQVVDVGGFFRQTREAYAQAEGRVDLIVWPETMLPVHGLEAPTLQTLRTWGQAIELSFAEEMMGLNRELGVPVLVGAPSYLGLDVQDGQWTWQENYNSAYLLDGEKPLQRYDKNVLTPFGEVMPYIHAWPWLEKKLLAIGAKGMSFTLDRSASIRRLELEFNGRSLKLATPICFEDTISGFCRRMVWTKEGKQVGLFVNLSNDGWFNGYDGGRQQHLQAARYRCIENRVPMIRVANTGLSVLIDSTGKVAAAIGEGRYGTGRQAGSLMAHVRLDSRSPLYGWAGDAWAWICLAGLLLLTGCTIGFKSREERSTCTDARPSQSS